ncbi:uncharacterized mitochondrial protein AtMg00860-like [Rosa rugosa]|uniref:uncharacterized mitochondrial protein AtMg00860-like n=1 Tax=Rosa rugosa TaxID=74645 RepID=UPI002B418257|nr:uncharacterized mitochondrial protein AtMg00860-like [Rosa rugosa]
MVQLSPVITENESSKVHPGIHQLLQQYATIFQPPTSLPPAGEQDHRIELVPNTTAINVRPYSPTLDEHLRHLQLVFEKLQQHSLKVKESKCCFGVKQVEYLGHIISAEAVAVDLSKIECIKNWPKPKTLKGLRGFLGLVGYYRKYVRHFGSIAKPLIVVNV